MKFILRSVIGGAILALIACSNESATIVPDAGTNVDVSSKDAEFIENDSNTSADVGTQDVPTKEIGCAPFGEDPCGFTVTHPLAQQSDGVCAPCHLHTLPRACGYVDCSNSGLECDVVETCASPNVAGSTIIADTHANNGVYSFRVGNQLRWLVGLGPHAITFPPASPGLATKASPALPSVKGAATAVIPVGFSLDTTLAVAGCESWMGEQCLGDLVAGAAEVGPLLVTLWDGGAGAVLDAVPIGTKFGVEGHSDKVRLILELRTAQSPDGGVFIVASEATLDHAVKPKQPEDLELVNTLSFPGNDFTVYEGAVIGWERTRLVKIDPVSNGTVKEWILERRTDPDNGCFKVPGKLGSLGVADCGKRLIEFHVIDSDTVVMVQNQNIGWPKSGGDPGKHQLRLVRFDTATGEKLQNTAPVAHCTVENAACGWSNNMGSLGWDAGSALQPLIPIDPPGPSNAPAQLAFVEVSPSTLEMTTRLGPELSTVGLGESGLGGGSFLSFWTRLLDGGMILTQYIEEMAGGLSAQRSWLLRLDADLNILWSRPIGLPLVATDSGRQLAMAGSPSAWPLGVLEGGALLLLGGLRGFGAAGCAFVDQSREVIIPTSATGDIDCSPTPDLCEGLNVAIDCDDNDASTVDDCQHSVGCYHIPWSFYEGLAAALPGGG